MHNPDDPQCHSRPTSSLFGGDFLDQPPHHCHHPCHYLYPQVLTHTLSFLSVTNDNGFVLTLTHHSNTCTPDLQPFIRRYSKNIMIEIIVIVIVIVIVFVIVVVIVHDTDPIPLHL